MCLSCLFFGMFRIIKENDMAQVPMESMELDKLPSETGWKFEEIARIVGSLYLESSHQVNTMKEHVEALLKQYKEQSAAAFKQQEEQIRQLEAENLNLKRELESRDGRKRKEVDATNIG